MLQGDASLRLARVQHVGRMYLAPRKSQGGMAYGNKLLQDTGVCHDSWNTQSEATEGKRRMLTWAFVDEEQDLDEMFTEDEVKNAMQQAKPTASVLKSTALKAAAVDPPSVGKGEGKDLKHSFDAVDSAAAASAGKSKRVRKKK